MADFILYLSTFIPDCPFYIMTGKYCPGCGNTRSLVALFQGNVLASLRYNISIVFLCLLGLAFCVEKALCLFDLHIKLFPRSNAFLFTTIGIFLAYFVIRNFIPYLTPISIISPYSLPQNLFRISLGDEIGSKRTSLNDAIDCFIEFYYRIIIIEDMENFL